MLFIIKTSPPMEKMGKKQTFLSGHQLMPKLSLANRVARDWAYLPLVGGLAGYELAADGAAN